MVIIGCWLALVVACVLCSCFSEKFALSILNLWGTVGGGLFYFKNQIQRGLLAAQPDMECLAGLYGNDCHSRRILATDFHSRRMVWDRLMREYDNNPPGMEFP